MIASSKNNKIKYLLKVTKRSSKRRLYNLIIVEGVEEINMALQGKYIATELFFCKKLYTKKVEFFKQFPIVTELTINIFKKIAYRKNSGGIIALFKRRKINLNKLQMEKNPILLIIEGVEKPGNLGAILRNSEAMGIDAVFICDLKTDPFHPNVIRASLGTIFIQDVIITTFSELLIWLRANNIHIVATTTEHLNSKILYNIKFTLETSGLAIVLGAEAYGLSKEWIKAANTILKIPMYGNINSLNVSNATAIILFEIIRQNFTTC